MGLDIHFHYYPKECDNKKVIPFLQCEPGYRDNSMSGRNLGKFFDELRKYCDEYDKDNSCYIIRDRIKLFEFAGRPDVPPIISDYLVEPDDGCPLEDDDIFIVWVF